MRVIAARDRRGLVIVAAFAIGLQVGDRRVRGSVSWSDEVAQAKAVCGQPDSPPDVQIFTGEILNFPVQVPCDRLR